MFQWAKTIILNNSKVRDERDSQTKANTLSPHFMTNLADGVQTECSQVSGDPGHLSFDKILIPTAKRLRQRKKLQRGKCREACLLLTRSVLLFSCEETQYPYLCVCLSVCPQFCKVWYLHLDDYVLLCMAMYAHE